MSESISPMKNIFNFVLMVILAFPAIWIGYHVIRNCNHIDDTYYSLCDIGIKQPLLFVNIIFFLNICILFWIISLLQDSTWLIDPYWTITPPLIGLFYHYHPSSHGNQLQCSIALMLTFMWSIRLTHSYLRRENYCFGLREDWRFTSMKIEDPKNWWWKSLVAAFLSQQPMLVGITLPLWAVNLHSATIVDQGFGIIDIIATIGCVAGLIIGYFADTQLYNFMTMNEAREEKGLSKVLILETGLWQWSRHPNYFGEQLWWWSLALYANRVGEPWVFIGTAFNTAIMMQVTNLTETRMLADKKRSELFKQYQARTSVWLPLPPRHKTKQI